MFGLQKPSTLLEDNDIGWAWWPWKRIETIVCPYSIKSNANYEAIIKYWKGEGAKPSVDDRSARIDSINHRFVGGSSMCTTKTLLMPC